MFAALSATNEAIMRAKSRDELFDMVCEAVASVSVGRARPGLSNLRRPSRDSNGNDVSATFFRSAGSLG